MSNPALAIAERIVRDTLETLVLRHGSKAVSTRDRANGRYAYSRFDRVCRCGHTLGQHTAEKVGSEQPCLVDKCDCECFRR